MSQVFDLAFEVATSAFQLRWRVSRDVWEQLCLAAGEHPPFTRPYPENRLLGEPIELDEALPDNAMLLEPVQ